MKTYPKQSTLLLPHDSSKSLIKKRVPRYTNKLYETDDTVKVPQKIHVVNGYTFMEFMTVLRGYELFTYKGKRCFKFEMFWSGINPYDIIDSRKRFSCQKIVKKEV
jgi:hypothetical protein